MIAQGQPLKKAGDHASLLGIASYSIQKTPQGVDIVLLNESGNSEGSVRLTTFGPGRAAEYVAVDMHTLRLTWNLELGAVTGATERDLQPIVITYDFQGRHWVPTERAGELLKSREGERLIAVLRDADRFQTASSGLAFVPVPHTSYYSPDGSVQQFYDDYEEANTGAAWSPACSGPRVVGSWGAEWRSVACSRARNDANQQCWNGYCIGCCSLADCDAACLVTDFVCYARVEGQSCSAP